MRREINFIVPGASKCGTTSLYYYLAQHTDIYLSPVKEPHFFDNDIKYNKGLEWYYSEYFPNIGGEKIVGEMTPGYLFKTEIVIPRIKKSVSVNPRFVIMLRDPVHRAWSHYLHMYRNGQEIENFEKALELEVERVKRKEGWFTYFYEGLYGLHLSKWFDSFGRNNFLILKQEDLHKNPDETIQMIFMFLGVENHHINTMKRYNQCSVVKYEWFNRFLRCPPEWSKRIYRLTLKHFINNACKHSLLNRLKEFNLKTSPQQKINLRQDTEQLLKQKYMDDIGLLEKITGIDCSQWKR